MKHSEKYSVLIVEDDPGYLFLLQNAISEISKLINVDLVYTGSQALELLLKDKMELELNRQQIPDIILANVHSDTFWLKDVQEIRAYSKFSKIPIYLFSSYKSELFNNKAIELGANGCFDKPYTFHELKQLVNNLMGNRAA